MKNSEEGVNKGSSTKKSDSFIPLSFKVDSEFAHEYKVFAAQHNKKLVEVLRESFLFYKQHRGG